MSDLKEPTHTVVHPSLYMRVNGKIQEMEVGAPLTLDPDRGKIMVKRGFAVAISKKEPVKKSTKKSKK